MDQDGGPVYIFHICRRDGSILFLHPFTHRRGSLDLFESRELSGVYGEEPQVETLTDFRNRMYGIIEREVKAWIADARFIPRFLLSAGVFILAYVVLSAIVRDPLPMLDEIAIALGLSIVSYFYLGRRDMQSETAAKKRLALRNKVDAIVFSESDFVQRVEYILQEQELAPTEELLRSFDWYVDEELTREHTDQAAQLVTYLGRRFSAGSFRRQERKLLKRRQVSQASEREIAAIKRWARSQKVDLPLFVTYLELKKALSTYSDVTADS